MSSTACMVSSWPSAGRQLAVTQESCVQYELAHVKEWRKDQALVNSDADGSVWTILTSCEFLSILLPKHR